ncbi:MULTISPECIES: MCE family protein [Gordonia]|uniref:Mce family protein n=2 Tax=Gordonia TaxID=2053 RepID=L7LN76_9ACTN|nr:MULTISPECIES: MCE family protein [Gordonia]ADG96491.1 MceE [Gordonia cholesterolivorans]AUH67640.1 MCE family protein [Gordonia sp. YC-JH1]KJR08281.1 mammalian cell entry protein [Gordonia sihwensis]MBY4568751.1 mammalian cell entry protein [Gordonia sihwensis]GAC61463.1 Mce family protein [Gordonia sihwensis NBRC 108236]
MRRTRITAVLAALLAVVSTALTGCRFDGANSLSLPGDAITGDPYRVTVHLADVQNLVSNSLVKYDNVTVGQIGSISVVRSVAAVEVDLSEGVEIPSNATVKLAQTSVLGAQYLEFVRPERPAAGHLLPGDTIDVNSSSAYPSTESVLAALSLVLNGSGLEQLRSIMTELNTATDGRTATANEAIGRLKTLVTRLNEQRDDIGRAIDALGRLSGSLADQNSTIAAGIDGLEPALTVLADQRENLTTMLGRVGTFGEKVSSVLSRSHDDLTAIVSELRPALNGLEQSGDDLVGSLLVGLTIPFPVTTIDKGMKGDFQNLFLTLDLSVGAIRDKVIGSLPKIDVEKMMLSRQAADPLRAPFAAPKGGRR